MASKKIIRVALSGSLLLGAGVGCSELPGNKETQGAVIGGVTGAAAGALVGGSDNRLIGGLIGGALGAGGGYLIGSKIDKTDDDDRDDAIKSSEQAQRSPATAEQARAARTADVNSDGYVTMDEVVALHKAGLSDDDIIERLDRTDMFFDLGKSQQKYLRDNGVSERVVNAMNSINPDVRAKAEERVRERQGAGSEPVGRGL